MIDQSVQHPPRILLLSVFRKWMKWERGFLRVDAKMIWRLRVVCNVTWHCYLFFYFAGTRRWRALEPAKKTC